MQKHLKQRLCAHFSPASAKACGPLARVVIDSQEAGGRLPGPWARASTACERLAECARGCRRWAKLFFFRLRFDRGRASTGAALAHAARDGHGSGGRTMAGGDELGLGRGCSTRLRALRPAAAEPVRCARPLRRLSSRHRRAAQSGVGRGKCSGARRREFAKCGEVWIFRRRPRAITPVRRSRGSSLPAHWPDAESRRQPAQWRGPHVDELGAV